MALAGLVFVVIQIAAAWAPSRLGVVAGALAVGYLLLGSVLCVMAVVLGTVQTGRGREVDVAGLFLLQGTVPRSVRAIFMGTSVVMAAVALATAVRAPFGLLALMLPVGAAGVWSGRHGEFPPSV